MEIDIKEFAKLDMRVGTVLSVNEIPGADKLLRLTVDTGDEKPRQLVAGIKQTHKAEELVGHQIVVVCNLKPAVLKGVRSEGMLLAADAEDGPVLLVPDKPVQTGTRIR
ncbi:MAG: methionine--tRNA ligase subunit beta [Candidatus Aenigmatarchaeota archaeon]